MDRWTAVLQGQAVQWLSPTTRQLFSNNSAPSLLEVLFFDKHLEYIRYLLLGSISIELHPVRYLSRYLLENRDPQIEIGAALTPPLLCARVIMLGAKLFGHSETSQNMSTEKQAIVENQQYQVAITAEILLFCQIFHATVMDVNSETVKDLCTSNSDCSLQHTLTEKVLHKGNKLATLIGDLLMARIYSQMGKIENSQVAEICFNALMEYGELMMLSNENLPKTSSITRFEFDIAYSGLRQLIGKSFRSVAIISGQGKESQMLSEELGTLIGSIIQEHVVHGGMERKSHPVNDNDKDTSLEIEQLKRKTIELISQRRGNSQASPASRSLVALIEIM